MTTPLPTQGNNEYEVGFAQVRARHYELHINTTTGDAIAIQIKQEDVPEMDCGYTTRGTEIPQDLVHELIEYTASYGTRGIRHFIAHFSTHGAPDIKAFLGMFPFAQTGSGSAGGGFRPGPRPAAGEGPIVFDLSRLAGQIYLVLGQTQIGKATLTAAGIGAFTQSGLNAVFVLCNFHSDETQFKSKVGFINTQLEDQGGINEIRVVGSDNITVEQLRQGGCAVVVLGNAKKIFALRQKIVEAGAIGKTGVWFDECDGNHVALPSADLSELQKNNHEEFGALKEQTLFSVLITATAYTVAKVHPEIPVTNMMCMKADAQYRSILSCGQRAIDVAQDLTADRWSPPGVPARYVTRSDQDVWICDPNIVSFTEFLDALPSKRAWKPDVRLEDGTLGESTPTIALEMTSHLVEPLKRRFIHAVKKTKKIVVIAWWGEHTWMRVPFSVGSGDFSLYGHKAKKLNAGRKVYFEFGKQQTPQQIMSWLHDLVLERKIGPADFSSVLIQTRADFAGRGTSHGESKWQDRRAKKLAQWFPHYLYTTFAPYTDLSEAVQRFGRLTRKDYSVRPRFLLSQKKVLQDVNKAYLLQEEIFHGMMVKGVPVETTLGDFLTGNVYRAEKMPTAQRSLIKDSAGKENAGAFFPNQTRNPEEATLDLYQCDKRGYTVAGAVIGEGTTERHAEFTAVLQNGDAAREGASIRQGMIYQPRRHVDPAREAEGDEAEKLDRLMVKIRGDIRREARNGRVSNLLGLLRVLYRLGPALLDDRALHSSVEEACGRRITPLFVHDHTRWVGGGHAKHKVVQRRSEDRRWSVRDCVISRLGAQCSADIVAALAV